MKGSVLWLPFSVGLCGLDKTHPALRTSPTKTSREGNMTSSYIKLDVQKTSLVHSTSARGRRCCFAATHNSIRRLLVADDIAFSSDGLEVAWITPVPFLMLCSSVSNLPLAIVRKIKRSLKTKDTPPECGRRRAKQQASGPSLESRLRTADREKFRSGCTRLRNNRRQPTAVTFGPLTAP